MVVNGLIPAAGMSKRMRQFKPLMKIGDKTMIEMAVDHMLEAQVTQVTVVLGYRGKDIRQIFETGVNRNGKVQFAYNPEYETTQMLDSVKTGLRLMQKCDWFFVAPGDMPAISADTYRFLREKAGKCGAKVLFPVLDGYRKHPPLVSWSLREEILKFQGMGLREFWKQYEGQVSGVPLTDRGCAMDADVREDYREICDYIREKQL